MVSTVSDVRLPVDLRYAVQFSPPPYRQRLRALCALYQEIREVLLECRDASVAETKLRWWEEEIDLMLDGKARHPVARAFQSHRLGTHLTGKLFVDIVDSARQDINPPSFAEFDSVRRYCNRRGGALATIAARLCGTESLITMTAARDLGCGWQLLDIVTRSGADAQLGRVYFAADDLRQHRVDQHVVDGVHSDAGLRSLLADYVERARQLIENAVEATPPSERDNLVTSAILTSLALARARKLARRDFRTGPKPVELSGFSALFTAWTAARRASRFDPLS